MKRHHLILAGLVVLMATATMLTMDASGGVDGAYLLVSPNPSQGPLPYSYIQPGASFYGQLGQSTTICPTSAANCVPEPLYFLAGFQSPATNTTRITQYQLTFPSSVEPPGASSNLLQVNGTLSTPSILGSVLAPGGDIAVTAWKIVPSTAGPKPASLLTADACSVVFSVGVSSACQNIGSFVAFGYQISILLPMLLAAGVGLILVARRVPATES